MKEAGRISRRHDPFNVFELRICVMVKEEDDTDNSAARLCKRLREDNWKGNRENNPKTTKKLIKLIP